MTMKNSPYLKSKKFNVICILNLLLKNRISNKYYTLRLDIFS